MWSNTDSNCYESSKWKGKAESIWGLWKSYLKHVSGKLCGFFHLQLLRFLKRFDDDDDEYLSCGGMWVLSSNASRPGSTSSPPELPSTPPSGCGSLHASSWNVRPSSLLPLAWRQHGDKAMSKRIQPEDQLIKEIPRYLNFLPVACWRCIAMTGELTLMDDLMYESLSW